MGTLINNQDISNDVVAVSTLLPNVRTATASGATVDRAGFRKAMFVVHAGTVTDGTFTLDPEESDDGSSWSNIDSADRVGSFTAITSSADDGVQQVGYIGEKRYVRCNVTVTGSPSTGGAVGVTVVKAGAISV